jgi:hypothetical protein
METDAPGQTDQSAASSLLYPVGRVATVIVVADPELVPTADAARQIGISSRTLARYAQQGVVRPAVVLPSGHLRWDVADLRRQLSELRPGGTSDANRTLTAAAWQRGGRVGVVGRQHSRPCVGRPDAARLSAVRSGQPECLAAAAHERAIRIIHTNIGFSGTVTPTEFSAG